LSHTVTKVQRTASHIEDPCLSVGSHSAAAFTVVFDHTSYSSWYISCVYVDWLSAGSEWILPKASQHKCMTYTNCCIYRVVPPDDEQ